MKHYSDYELFKVKHGLKSKAELNEFSAEVNNNSELKNRMNELNESKNPISFSSFEERLKKEKGLNKSYSFFSLKKISAIAAMFVLFFSINHVLSENAEAIHIVSKGGYDSFHFVLNEELVSKKKVMVKKGDQLSFDYKSTVSKHIMLLFKDDYLKINSYTGMESIKLRETDSYISMNKAVRLDNNWKNETVWIVSSLEKFDFKSAEDCVESDVCKRGVEVKAKLNMVLNE